MTISVEGEGLSLSEGEGDYLHRGGGAIIE